MFPNVFCDKVRSANESLLRIRVSERDLLWNFEPKPCWRENYFSDLTEKEITEEIESLLEEEIIRVLSTEEAIRAVVAPLNFLRKPNGKIRPTIDFRDINTYLKGSQGGTITPVADAISKIDPSWTVFNIVDVVYGYGSIPIDDSLSKFFAVHWKGVTYGFRRLPQGVNISPELFNNRMTHILQGLDVIRYFDDILVGGETVNDLFEKTRLLLQRFDEYGLTINIQKCDWFKSSVSFLGTELNNGTINPYHKLQAILQKLPSIESRHDVQRAVGLCQQVAPYCYKYTYVTNELKPFLKRENNDYKQANKIFQETVTDLCINAYRLTLQRVGPFHLYTDWCGNPLNQFGFVLFNSALQPCVFGSFATSEKVGSFLGELMGIVEALKQCFYMTKGFAVTVYSDNQATVEWLKEPTFLHKFKDLRIQRQYSWLRHHFSLDRLNFRFVEGKDNAIADVLSRWKVANPVTSEINQKHQGYQVCTLGVQQETQSWRREAIARAHKGHFGIRKTWLNLRSDGFRWENDYEDVKSFVRTCDVCQQFRQLQHNVDLGMIDSPTPNHTLCLDFIGPLPRGRHGYRFIATGIDAFTKFGTAQASKTCSTQIIKLLKNWIALNGPPERILCDNGAAFISKEFESFCERHGVDIIHTPAYAHKSAGTIEAYNKNFVNRLKRIWKEKRGDWTEHINECVQEINRKVHCTTLFCPRYLLKGIHRNDRLATDEQLAKDRKLAYERIKRAHEQSAKRYAKNVKDVPIHEGMEVSWYNSKLADRLDSKLYSKWVSPCVLTKKRSEHRWDIELPDGSYLYNVHRDFLQPFRRKIGGPMF